MPALPVNAPTLKLSPVVTQNTGRFAWILENRNDQPESRCRQGYGYQQWVDDHVERVQPIGRRERQRKRNRPPCSRNPQEVAAQLFQLDLQAGKEKKKRQPKCRQDVYSGVRLHDSETEGPKRYARRHFERHRRNHNARKKTCDERSHERNNAHDQQPCERDLGHGATA